MNISEITIIELVLIITGDGDLSPYRTFNELRDFFNEFEEINSNKISLTNRKDYTRAQIENINGTSNLYKVFRKALHPLHFNNTQKKYSLIKAVKHLNSFLKYDNCKIVKINKFYELKDNRDISVQLEVPFDNSYIEELSQKCEKKIIEGDFDGAITNARTLLEAALRHIENELNQTPPKQTGDLPVLLTRVKKLLNLDTSKKDLAGSLRQIIQGLTTVIDGLSGISNIMADRHAQEYAPAKYHAQLAVNASKTAASFILQSFSHQLTTGNISPKINETNLKNEEANLEQDKV
jgi:hypothetical protein